MNDLRSIFNKYFTEKVVDNFFQMTRQCINLEEKKGEPSLINSKLGGYGYLPKQIKYPINEDGKPLSLLAQ